MSRFEGTGDAADALREKWQRVNDATRDVVEEGSFILVDMAKANATVDPHVVTGLLRGSISASEPTSPAPFVWESTVAPRGVVYARIQELGGEIVPRDEAGYLRFMDLEGKYIYMKSVYIRPHPYLGPADAAFRPIFRDMCEEAWAAAWAG